MVKNLFFFFFYSMVKKDTNEKSYIIHIIHIIHTFLTFMLIIWGRHLTIPLDMSIL